MCMRAQAISDAFKSYVRAFAFWWGKGDAVLYCDSHKRTAAAHEVASAVTELWSNAKSSVTCEGQSEACGYGLYYGGQEHAATIAESVAQAAAHAMSESVAGELFCFGDLRAMHGPIAQAAAYADYEVCQSGSGSHEEWKASYLNAVQPAFEGAFSAATSSACSGESRRTAFCVHHHDFGVTIVGLILVQVITVAT